MFYLCKTCCLHKHQCQADYSSFTAHSVVKKSNVTGIFDKILHVGRNPLEQKGFLSRTSGWHVVFFPFPSCGMHFPSIVMKNVQRVPQFSVRTETVDALVLSASVYLCAGSFWVLLNCWARLETAVIIKLIVGVAEQSQTIKEYECQHRRAV